MEDSALIAGCVSGDTESRSEFIEKYARLIYKYIRVTVNSKGCLHINPHIQDISQDIFCSLFADDARRLKSFKARNGCSLASWLRQVTINFTLHYIRDFKSAVSLDEETEDTDSLRGILVDESAQAADAFFQKEQLDRLQECVEVLDTDAKYFLELHMHRGIKLEQLKEHLRLSRGAIDMYKSRLISRLRDCFKSKGFVFSRERYER